MTDTQTDRQVFSCNSCGTELEQYQHFCTCGQFSQESFAADERSPECEFFEDDKACGEDSEWFVFTQQIKPMCNSHLGAMRKNYRGRIEFYPLTTRETPMPANPAGTATGRRSWRTTAAPARHSPNPQKG